MSDSKISALPPAATLTGAELVPVVQSGNSVRTTASALGNNALGTYTPPGVGAVATTVAAKLAQTVSVLDFGADPTGVTNSSTAIANADIAATALKVSLYFPGGTYLVNFNAITRTGCSWYGDGKFQTTIKAATSSQSTNNTALIASTSINNWSIEEMGFDLSLVTFAPGGGLPGNIYGAIFVTTCQQWSVLNCACTGLQRQTIGIGVNAGGNFEIGSNYFNQPTPSTSYNQAINISNSAGITGPHVVRDNICKGTACFTQGSDGNWLGNCVSGWSFGSGITLGPNGNTARNTVIGNNCSQSIGGPDVNATYPLGIECWSLNSTVSGNVCYANSGTGIFCNGNGSVCTGNVSYNNGKVTASNGSGIGIGAVASFATGSNILCTNNAAYDNQGTPTQFFGINEFNSGGTAPTGNIIAMNLCFGNTAGQINLLSTTPAASPINGAMQLRGLYEAGKQVINNNAAATVTMPIGVSYLAFTGTNINGVTINVRPGAGTKENDGQEITVYFQAASNPILFSDGGFGSFPGFPAAATAGQVVRGIFHFLTNTWLLR